jgi:hypothetical protein
VGNASVTFDCKPEPEANLQLALTLTPLASVFGVAVSQEFVAATDFQLWYNGQAVQWTATSTAKYSGDTALTGGCYVTHSFEFDNSNPVVTASATANITVHTLTWACGVGTSIKLSKIAMYGSVTRLRADVAGGGVILGPYGGTGVANNSAQPGSAGGDSSNGTSSAYGGSGGGISGPGDGSGGSDKSGSNANGTGAGGPGGGLPAAPSDNAVEKVLNSAAAVGVSYAVLLMCAVALVL